MEKRVFRETAPAGAAEPASAVGALSVDEIRTVISNGLRLLDALAVAARGVIEAVPAETYDAVFVREEPVNVQPLANPQARPRGRAHPLIMLFKFSESSARLIHKLSLFLMNGLNQPAAQVADSAAALNEMIQKMSDMAKDIGLEPAA